MSDARCFEKFFFSILEYYLNKIFKFYNFYLVPSTILASKSLPSSSDASAILNACSRDLSYFVSLKNTLLNSVITSKVSNAC